MSTPSQLLLLADHIKLSLLERQRAIALNLSPTSQDAQITRSLESLRTGIEEVADNVLRLQEDGDEAYVSLTFLFHDEKLTANQRSSNTQLHQNKSPVPIRRPLLTILRPRPNITHSHQTQRPSPSSRLRPRNSIHILHQEGTSKPQ